MQPALPAVEKYQQEAEEQREGTNDITNETQHQLSQVWHATGICIDDHDAHPYLAWRRVFVFPEQHRIQAREYPVEQNLTRAAVEFWIHHLVQAKPPHRQRHNDAELDYAVEQRRQKTLAESCVLHFIEIDLHG